ncbi:hypothetical protein JN06_02445 [Bacteroides zoogleoformans]|nr:hypothetical protein C4H11_12780 [Bacteroides zoogleoformans]TWJ11063.1 hypothetical protein JN06_02445 [Bacteroides zoogleoformans]
MVKEVTMKKIINQNIVLFNIALKYNIIDISVITSWTDDYILNNEIDVNDYFIIELSWTHTKERIQEILMDEIYKRKITNLKIRGNLFFPFLSLYDLSSDTNFIFITNKLLALALDDEVEFLLQNYLQVVLYQRLAL